MQELQKIDLLFSLLVLPLLLCRCKNYMFHFGKEKLHSTVLTQLLITVDGTVTAGVVHNHK